MEHEHPALEFCQGLFETDEEKLIIRLLFEGHEDQDIIRELLSDESEGQAQ